MSNLDKVHIEPANAGVGINTPNGLSQVYTFQSSSGNMFVLGTKEYGKVEAFLGTKLAGSFEYYTLGKTLYPNDTDEDWDENGTTHDDYLVAINVGKQFKRQGLATAMVKYAMETTNCTNFERSEKETPEGQGFFSKLV